MTTRTTYLKPLYAMASDVQKHIIENWREENCAAMFSQQVRALVEKYLEAALGEEAWPVILGLHEHDQEFFEVGPDSYRARDDLNEAMGLPDLTHWYFLLPTYILHKSSIMGGTRTNEKPTDFEDFVT